MVLVIRADTGDVDVRRYSQYWPVAAGEVAALLLGEPIAGPHDIVIQSKHGQLQRISQSKSANEPLPSQGVCWRCRLHLLVSHVSPATQPALVAAHQKKCEQCPQVQQQLQEDEQQPRLAAQTALQIMQQLRELQPSQQPQQEDDLHGARSGSDSHDDDF